jgi:hypothetical protein
VLEDARNTQEAMGGEERIRVVRNDGCGEQDIQLLIEMLEVRATGGRLEWAPSLPPDPITKLSSNHSLSKRL